MSNPTELPDLDRLVRYDSFETDEGDELRVDPTGRWVRFDDVESMFARRAQPEGEATQAAYPSNEIMAEICEVAGYVNLSMQQIREVFDRHAPVAQHAERGAVSREAFDAAVSLAAETIDARNEEIANLRAAIAAQSQGAQAADAYLTCLSVACSFDHDSRERHAAMDCVRAVQATQQAAAPGASAQPHKIHELLRIYDEKNGDWCAVARAVESRYVDAASAPGTPEAPKGGA